jgi:hypothetical protein
LLSVGGEKEYREMRTSFLKSLFGDIIKGEESIVVETCPFMNDVSVKCPFKPIALLEV